MHGDNCCSVCRSCPTLRDPVGSNAKLLWSYPTLGDPMDCSPPGSSVQGIFHARILECMLLPFPSPMDSRGTCNSRKTMILPLFLDRWHSIFCLLRRVIKYLGIGSKSRGDKIIKTPHFWLWIGIEECEGERFTWIFVLVLVFFFLIYGPFLKSLLNLLQYCFYFMFWFFGPKTCGI